MPGQSNLAQRCKRFATASTSTQVAVLSWRYDVEMGTVKGNNRISRTIVIQYKLKLLILDFARRAS